MLSILFKYLIYTFGVLMVERQYHVTHMIYAIEAPIYHTIQAPTPPPKIYVQTVYKDPPPLPHPAVDLTIRSLTNSSMGGADHCGYARHHPHINSEASEAPHEITSEELKNHPEYRPLGEIDASEGRYAAKKYADKHRKISLRQEVSALVVYEQPAGPPPLNINWLSVLCSLIFSILIIFVCFVAIHHKHFQKIFELSKYEAERRLKRSRSALRLDWILRHIDLQNAYESETQRLKSKVIRLREKVADQRTQIRDLTTNKVENRFRYAFLNNQVRGLTKKVADLDSAQKYLRSLYDLTMAFMQPEAAFIRRYEKDAAEGEKMFWDKIKERPGKALTSPTQWWNEQRRDVDLAIKYIERKGPIKNWWLSPETLDRIKRKGMLRPGFFDKPKPSKKVLERREFIMRGW